MSRTLEWVRYGFCTALGLVMIGLAALSPPALDPDGPRQGGDEGSPGGD